jgi:hypothetical protein
MAWTRGKKVAAKEPFPSEVSYPIDHVLWCYQRDTLVFLCFHTTRLWK